MSLTFEILSPGSDIDIAALLRAINETPLDLATVGAEKLFEPGRSGQPTTWLARLSGEPAGLATVCGHFLRVFGVRRDLRRRGIGAALLSLVESHIAGQRRTSVTVGAEAGNYFVPGVVEEDEATLCFFAGRGYTSPGTALHLEVRLPCRGDARLDGGELSDALPGDREALLHFIRSEFSESWAFEVERGFGSATPPVVLARRSDRIVGFAGYELNNRGLGTFGPAGVSAGERGSGTGRALLLASLQRLSAAGHERAVIQWAAALPFYEKSAGARVMAHFRLLHRQLG